MNRIFENGHIYKNGRFQPGSILVENGIIKDIAEGKLNAVGCEITDLKGAFVLPGFEDAHTHPAGRARTLNELDLRGKDISWQVAREIIANKIKETPRDAWVVCHGWNAAKWNINRSELDSISGDRGIFIINISYHGGALNSKGLEILKKIGIEPKHDDGFVYELEYQKVFIATSPDTETYIRTIPEYHEKMFALGISAAHDMNVATFEQLEAYKRLDEAHNLKMRTLIYLNPRLMEDAPRLSEYIGHKGEMMEVRGLKLFLDGAIGTHTAALSSEYSDKHEHGRMRMNYDECAWAIARAAELGLKDIAMHCIGDMAVRLAVEIFEKLKDKYYGKIDNWRFEHFELADKEAIQALGRMGGIASMQPNFSWDALNYTDRLGDRTKEINPLREISSSGVKLVFGSDDMPSGPIDGIMWATSKAPSEAQRLSLQESIAAYTSSPAAMTGAGDSRGKIDKGFEADLAIFGQDPFRGGSRKVSQLWIKGELIWADETGHLSGNGK